MPCITIRYLSYHWRDPMIELACLVLKDVVEFVGKWLGTSITTRVWKPPGRIPFPFGQFQCTSPLGVWDCWRGNSSPGNRYCLWWWCQGVHDPWVPKSGTQCPCGVCDRYGVRPSERQGALGTRNQGWAWWKHYRRAHCWARRCPHSGFRKTANTR